MWKNIVELGRFQTTIRWMRIACWIHKTTNTLKICNNYCFSTVKMVARTDLNIMLHVYCLSYLRYIPTRDKATSLLMFLDPTQLDTHPHSRTQTHTNTLTHTNTYTHSRTQKHTLTHANTHTHTHARKHTHTLTHANTHAHTHGSTPLKEGSACRRCCCLHNTQKTQGKNTQVFSGIGTSNPSNGEP